MDVSRKWLFFLAAPVGVGLGVAYLPSGRESPPSSAIGTASATASAPTATATASARTATSGVQSFGYKGAWIAAKGISSEKLATALHLTAVSPSGWADGLRRSYDPDGPGAKKYPTLEEARRAELAFPSTNFVFVTPPVGEWTLAVGQRLAFFESFAFKNIPRDRHPDKLRPFIEALSKEIGTVQYFFTHRVPETHIWVWAESGRIVRAYGYSGERGAVLFNVGPSTAGEKALGLRLPARSEDLGNDEETAPSEQTVIDIAGKWSVDPTHLDDREDTGDVGLLGALP